MHVCSKEVFDWPTEVFIPRTETVYESMKNIGPDQNSVVIFATWLGQMKHFRPILTGEGLCYTFNAINSMEIYSDECANQNIH